MSSSTGQGLAAGSAAPTTGHPILSKLNFVKIIGTGTFARVYLVRNGTNQKFEAVKVLSISDVIRMKQIDHVKNERSILNEVMHPFLINLRWHAKDEANLYLGFPYICGGELFSYLRSSGRFAPNAAQFYAAEIVSALSYLHSLSIVYRDLKPENLLLDVEGHLKITDFGFSKHVADRTWTLCGTPEYLAPEIIQSKGHNLAVDWWALGILLYEMLAGYPPFFDDNPFGIYEKILAGKIEWPRHIDPVAKDLIKKLLTADRTKRLGSLKNGSEDVKRHRWFKSLDWMEVLNRRLQPPIVPRISHEADTKNYDEYATEQLTFTTSPTAAATGSSAMVTEREMRMFDEF